MIINGANKMNEWLPFAILALICWGLWSFFPKLSANYIEPESGLVFEVIGALIVGLAVLISLKFQPEFHKLGITYAVLTGIIGTLGILFFWFAVARGGRVSIVVPITALYPVIALMLAFLILKEPITIKQGIGIITALISILLLSS
jgi:transporter family protein